MKISEIDKEIGRRIYKVNYLPRIGGDPEFFIGDELQPSRPVYHRKTVC